MFLILATALQYGLLLGSIVFLTWLSLVSIIYQNQICASINVQKSIYQDQSLSSTASMIDSRLKLHHFTMLGTHNSYHRANLIAPYEHASVDKQLSFGIRQLELDIHIMKNNLLVYHLQLFDDRTNCYCLKDCLARIIQWSAANPYHFPVYVFFEIKQAFYEDLLVGLGGGVKCEHLQQIRNEVLNVFSLNTFILPSDIQGNQSSMRIALKQQRQDELSGDYTYRNYGWPPLYQSLGKLIPVFLDDQYNRAVNLYSTCDAIQSFLFVAQSNLNLPYSSIISIPNPTDNTDILGNIAMNGQIVRILLGYGSNNLDQKYQSAKPYGIHIISSDSEQCSNTALCQDLANDFRNTIVLCNNYVAPSFCTSAFSFL